MTHRFPLLAALVVALLAPSALAQTPGGMPGGFGGTITGVVVDATTGETLPSATAAVYADRDSSFVTGAAANLDGAFRVENVPPGRYQVRVSFVGYTTLRLRGQAVAPGQTLALDTLRLSADGATLGAAEVVGEREFVVQRADRTVYNVEAQAVTTGGSVLETLQTLPSLEVDTDGTVSLRGNQNVVVQINGRPVPIRGSQLASLLRQIPASRVARVEVIPNPSARYDPDGMSGIVNIVLVQGTDRGLSGGLTFGGGTQPNAELGGNLSYQAGPWDVYGSYGYRYAESIFLGTTLTERLALGLTTDQTQRNTDAGQNHFGSVSATYTLTPSTTLAFEGSAGLGLQNSANRIGYLNLFPTAAPSRPRSASRTATARTSTSTARSSSAASSTAPRHARATPRRRRAAAWAASAGAGVAAWGGRQPRRGRGNGHARARRRGSAPRATRTMRPATSHSNCSIRPASRSSPAPPAPTRRASSTPRPTTRARSARSASRPASRPRSARSRRTSTTPTCSAGPTSPDVARTNAFTYDEGVYAAYVQGAREFGALGVQAGLRAEAATRDFSLRGTVPVLPNVPGIDLTDTRQNYQSLFPSAFATYTFSPGSLAKASYSRRIERPRSRSLSPFPTYEDTLNVRVGNPQLRPEYTDAYELTLQYKYFLTVTPFFRHTTDAVRRRIITDPATGVVTQTALNAASQDSYGADVTLLASLGPVRGFLSGTAARQVVSDGSASTGTVADAMTYSARTSLQLRVRQGTDLQLFGFYRAPQTVEDGRISGFGFASLGLSQKVSDQLQLSARVNDLFSTSRFEYTSARDGVSVVGVRDPQIQQLSATLTYSFGSGQPRRYADAAAGPDGRRPGRLRALTALRNGSPRDGSHARRPLRHRVGVAAVRFGRFRLRSACRYPRTTPTRPISCVGTFSPRRPRRSSRLARPRPQVSPAPDSPHPADARGRRRPQTAPAAAAPQ